MTRTAAGKHFLFLQGPHGPFMAGLARALRKSGATVHRVGFNAGDRAFWGRQPGYIAFTGTLDDWPGKLAELIERHDITDILFYGDARPIHGAAAAAARERGLTCHVLEEGYLRPYWVTYERGGSNGNSPLIGRSVTQITQIMAHQDSAAVETPDHWGTLRSHILYGALYHFFVLTANRRYRRYGPHRAISVAREFRLQMRKLALMPLTWAHRVRATRRIFRGGFPYHLALMQLEHDANFLAYSPFSSQAEFIVKVIDAFRDGAPPHHHLVFKAHPLEDGRVPLRRVIHQAAMRAGISDRTHYLSGGKLAPLLDHAVSATTVNSTSAQQALWRGLPLRAFGVSPYSKPEFVSNQPLHRFFHNPAAPDLYAYRAYRNYLLATSQLPGSFYTARGRAQVIRRLSDALLDPLSPYERFEATEHKAAASQHLALM